MTRMAACLLAGPASVSDERAMDFLLADCAHDSDWRVQELLAKALTWRCEQVGWEQSLGVLSDWLSSPVANVRRATAEGPRIWTRRPYFAQRPAKALELLGLLRVDPSDYARSSAAHAISDIGKTEPELVLRTLERWVGEHRIDQVLVKQAVRHLSKIYPERTNALLAGGDRGR